MRVLRIGPHVVQLSGGFFSAYLVHEADGWTLVDGGPPGQAAALQAAIAGLGGRLRRVTLTHAHSDHVGSLEALMAAVPGTELALGAREARLLAGQWEALPGEPAGRLRGYARLDIDAGRLLHESDRLGSLQAISTPGHTPGHLALLDQRDGTLIAGDALFTLGGLAVAGTYRLGFCLPSLATWNRPLALQSARHLAELEPSRIASGHGPVLSAPGHQLARAIERLARQLGG